MIAKAVFSGFGGQGIIMMGYLVALAGMAENKNVTCLPSYGAEVRGGTANCTVVIADEEIASPIASEPELAVLMNPPSLIRYQDQIQSGGVLFLNSSLIESRPVRDDLTIYEIPANDLAKRLNEEKVANIILLGAFIKKSGWVSLKTMEQILKDTFSQRNPRVLEINRTALSAGFDYLT